LKKTINLQEKSYERILVYRILTVFGEIMQILCSAKILKFAYAACAVDQLQNAQGERNYRHKSEEISLQQKPDLAILLVGLCCGGLYPYAYACDAKRQRMKKEQYENL